MKKLLIAFGLLAGIAGTSFAANNPIYGVVQITTSTTMTPPLQSGAFNVSSGTVQNFTINSSTASSFNATVSSITTLTVQNFTVNQSTATSFNATVSSITTVTAQNFTAVQSTSTNLNSTNIVASTITLSGNIVGNLSGVAVPTGYVGEVVTTYNSVSGGGVPTVGNVGIATATLTTGYWYVSATYCSDNNATQTGFNALLEVKGSLVSNQQGNDNQQVRVSAGTSACASFGARSVLVAATDTNKTISVWATAITAVGSGFSTITAIRYK